MQHYLVLNCGNFYAEIITKLCHLPLAGPVIIPQLVVVVGVAVAAAAAENEASDKMTHSWSLLDDFLMSSLYTAVSLEQIDIVTVSVTKYLHLNVPTNQHHIRPSNFHHTGITTLLVGRHVDGT